MHIKGHDITLLLFLLLLPLLSAAQNILSKKISIQISQKKLPIALQDIAEAGNFHFSYKSDILSTDSVVSLSVSRQAVKTVLQKLLGDGYSYKETAGYIIIHRRKKNKRSFTVRGSVFNRETGAPLANVSVYESAQLQSDLTDKKGRYLLHLHTTAGPSIIHVSKFYFNDTSLIIQPGYDQSVDVAISPIRSVQLNTVTIKPNTFLGQAWVNRFFTSSRQKIRDINLSHFLIKQPFQYSVWPGIGTHGKLGAQISNNFSFNILGGYAAGLNGVELGGLFNLDKSAVKYIQIAGLFNSVGGKMTGFQAAGLFNNVLSGMKGVQIGGLTNVVEENVTGLQLTGILNSAKRVNGLQFAGVANRTTTTVTGIQLAGVLNITSSNRGLQAGLINIADSASGYAIGLINIIKDKGYRNLSLSWQSAWDLNLSYKTGRKKLYNILLAGVNMANDDVVVSVGYGLGKSFDLSAGLSLTTEITEQSMLNGDWGSLPLLVSIRPAIVLSVTPKTALFAGPAFSIYFPGKDTIGKGFKIPTESFSLGGSVRGWFGLHAGVTIF